MTRTALPKPRKPSQRAALSKEDRERLRLVILQQIERSRTMGLRLEYILPGCQMAGFNVKPAEIEAVITGELIPSKSVKSAKSVTGTRYLATPGGLDELKQYGLTVSADFVSDRDVQISLLAYELARNAAERTGTFDWPRCQRNARADRKR